MSYVQNIKKCKQVNITKSEHSPVWFHSDDEVVDGLDIKGQHGRQLVLQRHTHRPQRKSYPFAQAGVETCGSVAKLVKPEPSSGHSGGEGACVRDENPESCEVVCPLRIPFVIHQYTYAVLVR